MISRRSLFKGVAAAAAATAFAAPSAVSAANAPVTIEELRSAFQRNDLDLRKYLQQGMKDAGYYSSSIDGVWGPSTIAALEAIMASKEYQAEYHTWNYTRELLVEETLWFAMGGDGTDY